MEAQVTKNKFSIIFRENRQEFFLLILILIVIAISPLLSEFFLTPDNLMNLLRQSSYLVLVSIGMMIVVITGGIDLSVGAVMQIVGLCIILMLGANIPTWIAVIVALLIGAALGAINGALTVFGKLQPFIATLATKSILTGLVLTITEGASQAPSGIDPSFKNIGSGYFGAIPIPVIVMIIVSIIFWWLMAKTTYGRYVYTTGSNKLAASYAGVSVKKVEIIAYSLSGILAALSSILTVARIGSFQPATTHSGGGAMEVTAIAAAVIGGGSLLGGKGTIVGAVLGGIISSLLLNLLVLMNMNIWVQRFVLGIITLVAVLLTSGMLDQRKKH